MAPMSSSSVPSSETTYMGSTVFVYGTPDLAYDPGLVANLVCRIAFGSIFVLASFIPLKLLWRNGEFAATVFVVNNDILALFFIINAMIWHNNDVEHWWRGGGWCDIQQFCVWQMTTLYASSICAIMGRLAKQVNLARMAEYTANQKRKQLWIQAAIIFPVPILQVILASLVQRHRYHITAVRGCGSFYAPDAIFLIFLVLPIVLFTLTAVVFAIITYFRYKKVEQSIRFAHSANSGSIAASRSRRTKRKLYTMMCSILLIYTPIQMCFLGFVVRQGLPWNLPVTLRRQFLDIIVLIPYNEAGWVETNMAYVSIVTIAVVFLFFGTGKEALNSYRGILVAFGLAKIFPTLHNEWDPDRSRNTRSTFAQLSSGTQKTTSTAATDPKKSVTNSGATSQHISSVDTVRGDTPPYPTQLTYPHTHTPHLDNNMAGAHLGASTNNTGPDLTISALANMGIPHPSLRWMSPARFPLFTSSRSPGEALPASFLPSALAQPTLHGMNQIHELPDWSSAAAVRTRVWAMDDGKQVRRPDTSQGSTAPLVRVETRITRSTRDKTSGEH